MKKWQKRIIIILVCIIIAWVTVGVIDYWRACVLFENPIFCFPTLSETDCGCHSYTRIGLGYSFKIKGDFMPERYTGITRVEYYLFGVNVKNPEKLP